MAVVDLCDQVLVSRASMVIKEEICYKGDEFFTLLYLFNLVSYLYIIS